MPCSQAAAPNDLSKRIDEILNRPGLKKVHFSACVVRRDSGEVVYERNSRLALIPASNMKIVTTAGALEMMGPDFAFITRVGLSGESLVVIGGGDPLLGDKETDARNGHRRPPVFEDIIGRLKESGVVSLSDIILDVSVFDEQRVHPGWPANQLNQKYACEVSGLNYRGNCADVAGLNQGGRIVISLEPPTDYVNLINAVRPRSYGRSRISLDRTEVPGELIVSGTCRDRAGPYSFAVENPALFFSHLLRDGLVKAGIRVTGQILERPMPDDADYRPLAEYRTLLGDCLTMANKESLGLAAEALFKRLGAQANPDGKGGSWESGRRVLSDYLRELGVDDGDFYLSDGSGLSRDNRLSAWALIRVLLHLAGRPDWDFFESTLAVGGMDGTIEKHFWEKTYRGRVRAKSGYLKAVRALSGVVHTDGGDYIFSFLANRGGNGTRLAIDAAVKAIVDWGAAGGDPGNYFVMK
jgi:D-alanyl-D-alanine carboxypeptidase/D-alanyl-D-alanine-endopeptidase (penicillin-binding protein 4)